MKHCYCKSDIKQLILSLSSLAVVHRTCVTSRFGVISTAVTGRCNHTKFNQGREIDGKEHTTFGSSESTGLFR